MDESLTDCAEKPMVSFKSRISILYNVAKGLGYFHSHNSPVIHRDLSPKNYFVEAFAITAHKNC